MSAGQRLKLTALILMIVVALACGTCTAVVFSALPFYSSQLGSLTQVLAIPLGIALWIYLTYRVVRALVFEARHRDHEAKGRSSLPERGDVD